MSAGEPTDPDIRLVIGCMTGTSIDALDVALVRVRGRGLGMSAAFVRGVSRELGDLGARLRSLADQEPTTAGEIARLSREFALLHARAIGEVMRAVESPIALVSVHGQTVFHAPPVSWQMFNGAVLAREVGVPVVFDLRGADLAAGGQGAPITPLADWVLFRGEEPTAVVNLGGFSNATLLPGSSAGGAGAAAAMQIDAIEGYDICACNHLLDRVARECLGRAYDAGGAAALAGEVHAESRDELAKVLRGQSRLGRSLGTGDETGPWIQKWGASVAGNDLAASACAAIGGTIAERLGGAGTILVAGGGAHNTALVRAISQRAGVSVEPTSSRDVPIEFREAAEMGVLGALCQDRVPITLARVTGMARPVPVSGVWAGV